MCKYLCSERDLAGARGEVRDTGNRGVGMQMRMGRFDSCTLTQL